jgi:shikimate dehydrogenase
VTRIAAVLGWPIGHSRSPVMFDAAFQATGIAATMVPMAVSPPRLAEVISNLRARQMLGASVTVPHKVAVASLCDRLTASAQEIGAVNCLELAGGALVGHNTDASGFVDGLRAAGFPPQGKHVTLLGAGGGARAVAYGLQLASASTEVIARSPDHVTWIRAVPWTEHELRAALSRSDLVVDCTSAALTDDAGFAEAVPLDALPSGAWVATLIYHRPTALLERASARGYSTLDGRAMLVNQGAHAFRIWTGQPAPIDVMTRALDEDLKKS